MTATNVNVTPINAAPLGGAGLKGTRLVYIEAAKAAQNDTITLQNVKELLSVSGTVKASNGALTAETYTATGLVITLTSSAVGTVQLMALVR